MELTQLLERYDVQVPRYTSYPAVPYWNEALISEDWISSIRNSLKELSGWALYIHIPFCETLCTFCGCNNIITKNHGREAEYVDLLLKELSLYLEKLPELKEIPLKQIHLGGGSPTFMSADHLKKLVTELMKFAPVNPGQFEGAIEVDPRRVTYEQLKSLRDLGFNRVSLGVQDLDPEVQRLINRTQPVEMVEKVTGWVRELGYQSVNFDLIYGLPKQTLSSFKATIQSVLNLRPERIALYSMAKVPWIKPAQRLFKDEDLPSGGPKRELYEKSRELLLEAGYIEIGIDHFALPEDALAIAHATKRLHRNFMGYTNIKSELTLALGVSAISESKETFHQNHKDIKAYTEAVTEGKIPTFKGHHLSEQDQRERQSILELMTQMEAVLPSETAVLDAKAYLKPMIDDGLVRIDGSTLQITPLGMPFVRNVCTVFDRYLRESSPQAKIFSSAL